MSINTNADLIATVLSRLENPAADEYFIAFGPAGRQFIGTPNGYTANFIPPKPLAVLGGCDIKKVLWASYGDAPESWIITYEFKNGVVATRLGDDVPLALRSYIDQVSVNDLLLGSLRVQLGANGSFIAWNERDWACSKVPTPLRAELRRLSVVSRDTNSFTAGFFSNATIKNVQWHADGAFYLEGAGTYSFRFTRDIMHNAWECFWHGLDITEPGPLFDIAYIAIDSHAKFSDTFAMIKKQKKGEEAPFILRFSSEPVHYRLPAPLHKELRITEVETDADDKSFQWAYSLKSGRPRNDEWELELKKGQKIKVLQDRGRDWLVVADTKGKIGFTHRSWLDFSGRQLRLNPLAAWNRFAEDASKIVQYGNLSEFPQLKKYMDTCTKAECMAVKENASSLGICAHDLRVLLEGSGCYAYEWVKNGRNMWHPDRFARHCMPEHAERLKVKAQELFVLYGTLMEGF